MPVYCLYGDERYLIQRELAKLRESLVDPAMAALSHKILERPSLSQVLETVGAVSFGFGQNTVIEIHEFQALEKAASDADKHNVAALMETLPEIEPTKHVIFVQGKLDKKVKFAKWMTGKGNATVIPCQSLPFYKTEDAVSFVMHEAKAKGISIEPRAASLLVDVMGVSFQPLVNELEKLSVYAADRTIVVDDVSLLSNHSENTFQMLEAWVLNRPRAEVYHILEEVLLRQHPIQIFRLLQGYLDNAFRLNWWQQQGWTAQTIAEHTKKHPFKVKKDMELFRRVSVQRLQGLKDQALKLEWKAKTGKMPDRLALEVLLSA